MPQGGKLPYPGGIGKPGTRQKPRKGKIKKAVKKPKMR
jgi:hypothetical protein